MIAQMDNLYIKTRPTKAVSRLLSYSLFEGRPVTTKGQWINPLVFTLFALEKRIPQLKKIEKPIFIIGTGRSGTTILGIVLSMHREVGFLNEPKALWHAIYPDEDLVGSYSREEAHYRLTEADVTPEIRLNAHRLFGAYLTAVGSKRVVDKYPELIFRTSFVSGIFPDAKFIFLVRNGWDTCRSIQTWSKRLGVQSQGEIHDWWGVNNRKWDLLVKQVINQDPEFQNVASEIANFTEHTDMAAVEWVVTMREGMQLMKQNPNNLYMLRYEDLASSPQTSLKELLEFCELPPDDTFLDYACQTLSPAPAKKSFPLNPAIVPLFEKTMQELDYTL
ncbi:MAG TPA: sulfotransferase [Halomicronema sp.]